VPHVQALDVSASNQEIAWTLRVLTATTEIWKLPWKRALPGGLILSQSMSSRSQCPRSASVVRNILLLAQHFLVRCARGAGSP